MSFLYKLKMLWRKYILREAPATDLCNRKHCLYKLDGACYRHAYEMCACHAVPEEDPAMKDPEYNDYF